MRTNRTIATVAAIGVVGLLATLALGATSGGAGADGLKQLKRDVSTLAASSASSACRPRWTRRCAPPSRSSAATAGPATPSRRPSSANHNPVAVAVLVTRNGAPRPGLKSSAFDFSNKFVPAGGPSAVRCPAGGAGCASPGDLFQDGGDGTYVIYVHPGPAGANWKAGSYHARVTVTDPAGRKGSAPGEDHGPVAVTRPPIRVVPRGDAPG